MTSHQLPPRPCECEHIAHLEPVERTPNGNPGHDYGAKFVALYVVETPYGTFHVCRDCAADCHGKKVRS